MPRLLRLLKPLLKPEFASLVESIDEPSAVLRALLATDAGGGSRLAATRATPTSASAAAAPVAASAAAVAAPAAAPAAAPLAARARPPLPLPKAELEERIASVQARLRLQTELCCEQAGWGGLAPQWHRRDVLALLLSREVCGPNPNPNPNPYPNPNPTPHP